MGLHNGRTLECLPTSPVKSPRLDTPDPRISCNSLENRIVPHPSTVVSSVSRHGHVERGTARSVPEAGENIVETLERANCERGHNVQYQKNCKSHAHAIYIFNNSVVRSSNGCIRTIQDRPSIEEFYFWKHLGFLFA